MYDITKRETFQHLEEWLEEIQLYCSNKDAVKLLVGNKADKVWGGLFFPWNYIQSNPCKEERQVSREEAIAFARSKEMVFIETSAKTKLGIQQTFDEIVEKVQLAWNALSVCLWIVLCHSSLFLLLLPFWAFVLFFSPTQSLFLCSQRLFSSRSSILHVYTFSWAFFLLFQLRSYRSWTLRTFGNLYSQPLK